MLRVWPAGMEKSTTSVDGVSILYDRLKDFPAAFTHSLTESRLFERTRLK